MSVPSVAVTVMGYIPVAVEAVVATFMVEVTAVAPTMTVAGVKLAVAPAGSPLAPNVTLPVYPRMGVMVVVYVAEEPAVTDWVIGGDSTEKSGSSTTMLHRVIVPAEDVASQ